MNIEDYGLDLHGEMLLEEYRDLKPVYEKMQNVVLPAIQDCLKKNNLMVTAIESRIKAEESLVGKLKRKGHKYASMLDITDILGMRIITFYLDEVDKISAFVEQMFDMDWKNSVDKRKQRSLDSFGYVSLHYICRIPKELYFDPEMPQINEIRFEIQMRTALQHVWSNLDHEICYKAGLEIPQEYLRTLNRLAGLMELADTEFARLRTDINNYRFKIESFMQEGKLSEVTLSEGSFARYLEMEPFKRLNERIAAINQAEIHHSNLMPFYQALKNMGFTTLGDVESMRRENEADAFRFAVHRIGKTDLDIVSSTIGLQYICSVYLLKKGAGKQELCELMDAIAGPSSYNEARVDKLLQEAASFSF